MNINCCDEWLGFKLLKNVYLQMFNKQDLYGLWPLELINVWLLVTVDWKIKWVFCEHFTVFIRFDFGVTSQIYHFAALIFLTDFLPLLLQTWATIFNKKSLTFTFHFDIKKYMKFLLKWKKCDFIKTNLSNGDTWCFY